MRFPYVRHEVEPSAATPDGVVYRPEIPLHVIGPKDDVYLMALVDTGADESILPLSLADLLGVNVDIPPAGQVEGLGGSLVPIWPGEVHFELERDGQSLRWKAQAGFADFGSGENAAALLGHAMFLNLFSATFDGVQRELTLVPTEPFPGAAT